MDVRYYFKITFPVFCGYMAMGLAFGIIFVQNGYHWTHAFAMGFFVYAGAAQFLVLGLLTVGVGLFEIVLLTFTVNLRHLLYGLSFLNKFGKFGFRKIYLIFALSDETYAILTSVKCPHHVDEKTFIAHISIINHFYWTAACTIGGLIGSMTTFQTHGIEFVVTALFVVLFIEQCKTTLQTYYPVLIAVIANILAIALFGQQNMLIPALVGSIGLLYLRSKVSENV